MVKSKRSRKANVMPKSRKESRKEKRVQKKENKKEFFSKKKTNLTETSIKLKQKARQNDSTSINKEIDDEIISDFDLSDNEINVKINKIATVAVPHPKKQNQQSLNVPSEIDRFLEIRKREKKKQKELERKMRKQRIVLLKEANEDEDKIIRKLEKKLNIDKHRNETSVHKMFTDGLDYALELCLPDNIQKMYSAAKEAAQLNDASDNDFQEDLALALGKDISTIKQSKKQKIEYEVKKAKMKADKNNKKLKEIESKYLGDFETDLSGTDSELDGSNSDVANSDNDLIDSESNTNLDILNNNEEADSHTEDYSADEYGGMNKLVENIDNGFQKCDRKSNAKINDENNSDYNESKSNNSEENKKDWEDIYGRKRDVDGNIIEPNFKKYVPPHVRSRIESESTDAKRKEKIDRLKKQCKGFLNRLSEANMHKIASDIEKLYMNNSRFDMNNTITQLIFDALVSNVLVKERMVLEHTMLLAVLHTNVGTEIGAHFLQTVINTFDKYVRSIEILDVENKELDNIVFILSHLYTFKIYQHSLIFEIIKKLVEKLCEKSVECVLLILRSIGFQLRKDDPTALKNLILSIQKQSNNTELSIQENPRFKFLLEILNAIKNNNMNKIPQYDPELAEHLKKVLRSMFSNGKYMSTINITMEDLLKADEKGKWWVVGSAWSGNIKDIGSSKISNDNKDAEKFSEKLLALAKNQRMNTDDRRNVFCIIMSAEDYIDSFERLLHLSLKDQKIISSIIIQCCLSENIFNPYYAVLAQKFCDYDRKYQLAIQFTVWDRIKDIHSSNKQQVTNLAQFLIFLIVQGAQPISILKVIEFAELDKITLRLVRQIFLGILLGKEMECQQVFKRIAPSMKLNNFKDSIRLFMHHFLLKGTNTNEIPKEQLQLLKKRITLVDKTLSFSDTKLRF